MGNLFGNSDMAKHTISSLILYALIIGGMYFFLFRPQQKRKKQEEELRNSVKIGDEITTIGGIVGRVISIKNDSDSLVLESGSEKIRLKKWAIATVNPVSDK